MAREMDEKQKATSTTKRNGGGRRRPSKNNYRSKDPAKCKSTNDVSWYATDSTLLRNVASIPFSDAIGTPVSIFQDAEAMASNPGYTVPGICTLLTQQDFGYSNSADSAINVASNAIYTFVRHANSGHSNYDAPDLMIYLMAMSNVYAYINYLMRNYGILTLYAQYNRYLPDSLLTAIGVDAEDYRANMANLRYGINLLINKAAAFAVPANMPVFNRIAYLYQNVYTEGSSIKDQLYLYKPAGFWTYELDSLGAGKLTLLPESNIYGHWSTVQGAIDFGNYMLSKLIYSEDMNIMSGDILKAYGTEGCIKLQSMPDVYNLLPLHDPIVLEQMKNATVVPYEVESTLEQSSDHSYLISGTSVSRNLPSFWQPGVPDKYAEWYAKTLRYLGGNKIVTTESPDPTPELVMEITQLTASVGNYSYNPDTKTAKYDIFSAGVIVKQMAFWGFISVAGTVGQRNLEAMTSSYVHICDYTVGQYAHKNGGPYDEYQRSISLAAFRSNFKYAPALLLVEVHDTPAEDQASSILGLYLDVDNYVTMDDSEIRKLHDVSLLSQYHVPSISKLS